MTSRARRYLGSMHMLIPDYWERAELLEDYSHAPATVGT